MGMMPCQDRCERRGLPHLPYLAPPTIVSTASTAVRQKTGKCRTSAVPEQDFFCRASHSIEPHLSGCFARRKHRYRWGSDIVFGRTCRTLPYLPISRYGRYGKNGPFFTQVRHGYPVPFLGGATCVPGPAYAPRIAAPWTPSPARNTAPGTMATLEPQHRGRPQLSWASSRGPQRTPDGPHVRTGHCAAATVIGPTPRRARAKACNHALNRKGTVVTDEPNTAPGEHSVPAPDWRQQIRAAVCSLENRPNLGEGHPRAAGGILAEGGRARYAVRKSSCKRRPIR